MTPARYAALRQEVIDMGYGDEIEWSETVQAPAFAEDFALEAIFVICNSGMKATVARGIYERVRAALLAGKSASTGFGHPGKVAAIDEIWRDRDNLLAAYLAADDQITFLADLPFIGAITKYHLARNFGLDFAKPDRHLERIAQDHGTTPAEMCAALAEASGDRIGTVDLVVWRAAERGLIKTLSLEQDKRQGVLL